MRLVRILRCTIDGEDAQTALARHEETHDLRRGAEVERGEFLRCSEELRREPRLLIHRLDDFLQRMPPVACGIMRTHTGDEPLPAYIAERNEDAPAHSNLRERLRQNIGELLRNALDRNVDIHISHGHMFTFSPKKPLHETSV